MIRAYEYTVYVVRCDICDYQNRSVADGFGTTEQAYESAIACGWHTTELAGKPLDICPTCVLRLEPS